MPIDRHFSDDARLMDHVAAALEAAAARPDRLVLLGMIPDAPETEYGWIERDATAVRVQDAAVHSVRRFWEKPSADFSREVLATRTGLLSVMPVRGVTWSDLGSPERVRRARGLGELVGAGAAA